MRILTLLALPILMLCVSCSSVPRPKQPDRVLFVGNSLTYVGNVPAIFSALAEANSKMVVSDMIVRGGATLTQRLDDGSVARALSERKYSALVMQERGGDLMCTSASEKCELSRNAVKDLVAHAKEYGVDVLLLGTYQPDPTASERLIKGESAAAAEAGIPYIEVSDTLQQLRDIAPELTWFGTDGLHPGKDLALLNAILVYHAIYGSLPSPGPLTVIAPIYESKSGLTEALREADAAPPLADTPGEVHYSQETVETLLANVRRKAGTGAL